MFADLSLVWLLALFAITTVIVVIVSIRATALADIIADRTGFGEAMAGAIILGGATSLAGIVVSIDGAASGDAAFAFSNAVGGIAAQTLFLAIADMLHRGVNLEHAAAEPANLFQAIILIVLLALPMAAVAGPDISFFQVHPVSVILVVAYIWGMKSAQQMRDNPLWKPVETDDTRHDEPENEDDARKPVTRPALIFAGLVAIMGVSGWIIAQVGGQFITRFGLASSLVGALITALVTSLPEFVTTLAAVRRGALQLAVGGIIGGNIFDTLFLTLSDIAYRDGSLYHAVGLSDVYWLATGLLMTAILLAGLILRQRRGPARIGIESVLMITVYACAVAIELLTGKTA